MIIWMIWTTSIEFEYIVIGSDFEGDDENMDDNDEDFDYYSDEYEYRHQISTVIV